MIIETYHSSIKPKFKNLRPIEAGIASYGNMTEKFYGPLSVIFTESEQTTRYFYNDLLHRLDGPALISKNYIKWVINGLDVTDKIYRWAREMNIDLDNLSEEDKALITMVWSDYA